MITPRIGAFALAASAALAVAGCSSYGDYGYGRGYASLGYGTPYRYYSPYSYYGWYDNYYYPGVDIYIYDRGGSRYRWNDRHRHYWQGRRGDGRRHENWGGYRRGWDRDGRRRR